MDARWQARSVDSRKSSSARRLETVVYTTQSGEIGCHVEIGCSVEPVSALAAAHHRVEPSATHEATQPVIRSSANGSFASRRRRLFGLLSLVLALLCTPSATRAEDEPEAHIAGLHAVFEGPRILVSFRLEHAFDERVRERVESGLSTGFTFELRLVRDRWYWDRGVRSTTVETSAQYNPLTFEFTVHYKLNRKLVATRVVQGLDELRTAMTRVDDLAAFELTQEELSGSDDDLRVRVRAEVGSRTMMSMIPVRVTTDWESTSVAAPDTTATGTSATGTTTTGNRPPDS